MLESVRKAAEQRSQFEQDRDVYHQKRRAFIAALGTHDNMRITLAAAEATHAFNISEKSLQAYRGVR